jgi:hypothetical protein
MRFMFHRFSGSKAGQPHEDAATHMPGLPRPNTRRFGTLTTDFEEKIVVRA